MSHPTRLPFISGHLALVRAGKLLPLEVLHSASGHYIGTREGGRNVSRESREYFRSYAAGLRALKHGAWSQLTVN
ncbi:hypothetical protein JQN63_14260 [Delftia lacustris]|uniref:hypothetical protein n=1 Tax=Delftia lacustris TaxID=558537 RepID=UPI00193B0345|nr:hypothetical protein [Delftia lacustris]QRI93350.1 hypothetical protein JQN63_14260 [Delftia lacustris]